MTRQRAPQVAPPERRSPGGIQWGGTDLPQADCKLKVNRGLAKKRKPHDSCFANKHLNNEELSWGKNTLPKLTEKS